MAFIVRALSKLVMDAEGETGSFWSSLIEGVDILAGGDVGRGRKERRIRQKKGTPDFPRPRGEAQTGVLESRGRRKKERQKGRRRKYGEKERRKRRRGRWNARGS